MANSLMFEVGVKEAGTQLTDLERRLKNIVSTYGKLKLKVQVDGLKAFTSALENIGQSKGLDALQKRIDVLQVTLANVGMSGAKSIQEFEAAVKVTSSVAEQYTRRINEMTAARDKFANGSTQWMALNSKLTDYQNDKQVLAIYAQEQVAIKNLEEAKTRLGNTNNQEAESYQKVITSIETLNAAANTLKATLGTWDSSKGSIAQLVEQFEKLKNEISTIATTLKGIDPSKLNLNGLNINIGSIAGLGDLNSAIRGLEVSINEIIRLFSNLTNAVKLQPVDEQVKALLERCEKAEAKLREVGDAAKYLNERAGAKTQQKASTIAGIAGVDEEVTKVTNTMERYLRLLYEVGNQTARIGRIQNIGETFGIDPVILRNAQTQLEALLKTLRSAITYDENKNPILNLSASDISKMTAVLSVFKAQYRDIIKEADRFNKATEKGSSQAESRIRKLGMAFNDLKGYMKANGGSEEMKRLQSEIQGAIQKMRQLMNAGNFAGAVNVYERMAGSLRQAATATKEYERSVMGAASANSLLTSSEHQLANALRNSSDNMKGQSQVLSDLKMMATQYLGVWGAQGFLRNVIEIGGQLEMQRLSIGAILGDMAKANELFDRIKNLAVKSPFGVVELDQMTKQLSAYGFEYNELFDMTKRLADISAATGTSVDRLALALGHVRSEAALSGYTLRQFSMANIPLAKKLSEELTKVEGKFVSVADVRKRVRTKDIGYEQVLKVLKDLTDEGGMFYNAQEIMSESVKARFKNLKDSMDIMYGEIAESSVGDALKDVASLLTTLTRHWQELGAVLVAGAGYWAVNRIAMMAMSKAAVTNNIVTGQFTAKQLEAQAVTGNLTRQQLLRAVASRKMAVADAEAAANVLGLTTAQLQLVRRTGDVSRAMTMATVATSKYSIAQLRFMAMFRSLSLFNLKDLFLGIASGAKAAGVAVLGLVKSFWPMLALSAVAEVFMSMKREAESFADAANYVGQSARNLMKDIDETISSISKAGKPIDADALRESVKTMKEVLEQSEYYTAEQQNQVDNAKTLSEKYDVLLKQLKEMREEAEWQTNNEGLIEKILSNTGKRVSTNVGKRLNRETGQYEAYESQSFGMSFFNDSLQENIDQVNKSNASLQSAINLLSEYQGVMDEAIRKNNSFGLSLEGKSWQEQIRIIAQSGHWEEFVASVDNAGSRFEKTADNVKKASEKVRDDWEEIVNDDVKAIRLTLMEEWGMTENEITQFAKNNERTMRWLVDSIAKSLSKLGVAEQVIDEFKRKLLELFGVASGGKPNKKEPTVYDLQTGLGKQIMSNVIRHNKNNGQGGNGVLTVKEVNEITGTGEHEKSESEVVKALKERAQKDYQTMKDIGKIYGETSKKYQDAKKKYERSLNIAESNGISTDEILTGKYKDKKDNKNIDTEAAKAVRERVRVIKEASDAFQYWRDKVGDKSAWEHVQSEFGDVLKKIDITAYNIEDVRGHLKKIPQMKEYKAITDKKVKTEIDKEIAKDNDQFIRKDFERDTEKWVSSLTRDIDELTRKWDIFNSVVETTGDRMLAARLTGITPGATPADLKRLNVSIFAGVELDFDSVLGMSDDEIDKYVEKLGAPEEKIKAIQNGLKDWKKAQEDVSKSDIMNYAKWLGGLVDLQSIQTRNQEEYNQTLEETNRLLKEGKITQEEADKRMQSATTTLDTKNWQATSMYSNLYNNAQSMAEGEFFTAFNTEMANLFDQFKQGNITAADYAEKIEKLNKIQTEFSSRGFLGIRGGVGAFLGGGYQGLIDYHRGRAKDLRSKGKKDEAKEEDDRANSMEKSQKAADQLMKAFQDLANGANLLGDLFANIGWEGGATAMSDAGDILGGAMSGASSLSALGPWGMAAGAALGVTSSLFALHDKALQRQIDAIKEQTAALEANTDAIKTVRSRTLGYDEGLLRRRFADQYSGTTWTKTINVVGDRQERTLENMANAAMREYYKSNSSGSGYKQELENLKKERENYLEMYNLESDKKNESQEALNEYKKKIAELDDQIMYFVEDMTKELWGIDFKSWASQISDALWTAFENGENALDAFHDAAKDIIADVAKRMMNIHLIEPVFNALEDALFGKIGANGQRVGGAAYNTTTGEFNEKETLEILGRFFGEDGEFAKVVEQAEDFYRMAQNVSGFDFSTDESSSSTGSSIKGITEQTADLLASYINAIRASTSNIENLSAQYFPMYYAMLTSGNASLANIENHTAAIMRSNDSIASNVAELQSDIRGLKNKTWKMPVA